MMQSIRGIFNSPSGRGNINDFDEIRDFGDNLELVQASTSREHLIAHGQVRAENSQLRDVRTAIRPRGNNAEFSTTVGQVPDNSVGRMLPESLNHRLPGKCVTFDSAQRGKRDLVHVTERPLRSLNQTTFNEELEDHAKAKVVIGDILDSADVYSEPDPNLNIHDAAQMAQQLVDSRLELRKSLEQNVSSSQYFPLTQGESY